MTSLEEARRLLNYESLSDEEVENIRDDLRSLAEIIYEQWAIEKKIGRKAD